MIRVKKISLVLLVLMFSSYVAAASAQDKDKLDAEIKKIEAASKQRTAFSSPAWGAVSALGTATIRAAYGFGKIGVAALESMARQPETAGRVQTGHDHHRGPPQGVTFFALVVCFLLVSYS